MNLLFSGYSPNTLKSKWRHTVVMGALDSKAFSGAAIVAALLFVVSAIVVVATDDGITGDAAKYVLLIAGIVALIYSFTMFSKGASFVRKVEGVLLIVTGLMFAVTCFMDTPGDFIAYDGIVAFITLVVALLAYWTAGTYGAMYVSAVLAAFEIAMAVYSISDGYDDAYAAVILVIFAVFLVVDAVVRPYIAKGSEKKTREVIEAPRAQKKEGSMAKRTKATPKAKKVQKDKPQEKPAEEPKAEQKPVQPKPQQAEEQKPAEAPAAEPPAEEKKEQKRPDKATGEFMEKLMRSKDANSMAAKEGTRAEDAASSQRRVRSVQLPETDALKAERAKAAAAEKAAVPEEEPEAPAAPAEETPAPAEVLETPAVDAVPAAEPVAEAKPVIEEDTEESVISEPIHAKAEESEFSSKEPDWGHVVKDSSVPAAEAASAHAERTPAPAPAEAPVAEADIAEPEAPVEEVLAPAEEEEIAPAPAEAGIPEAVAEAEVAPAPAEEEIAPAPVEEAVPEAPAEEEVPAPAEEEEIAPAPAEAGIPVGEAEEEAAPASVEPAAAGDAQTEDDAEPGEDIYTDNSPEALVRRAAWNKGLRCRRNYGDHQIPVAFVKGKVAVYVAEPGADDSSDDALRSEGWTVLRFDASKVTDGKAEGEQIAEAVKANAKAAKKRKARK